MALLHEIISEGEGSSDVEALKRALEGGASVDETDDEGNTPLILAAFAGDLEAALLFGSAGLFGCSIWVRPRSRWAVPFSHHSHC